MVIPDFENDGGFKGGRMIVLPTEAFQDYVDHPQVKRLYLTDIGYFPSAKHHFRERKEGIEEYIFMYCAGGSGTVLIDGRQYVLHESEAFCIPRFKRHSYCACADDPWSILWVHFKGEDTVYYPLDQLEVIHFISENSTNRMLFLFDLLFRVLEGNYTLGNFIYISQVLALILAETYNREKGRGAGNQNRHVTNIVKYMSRHLYDNLTMTQISEEFELSQSYLNTIFQKYTQHAPMDFFIRMKMKDACKLLRSTDLYVYEVAQKLGYRDPYYFSRIFKKIVGISPNEYRDSEYFHYGE